MALERPCRRLLASARRVSLLTRRVSLLTIVCCLLLSGCTRNSSVNAVRYRIFCVKNKDSYTVDIGTRSLEDMRIVYGPDVCMLGKEFDALEQAVEELHRQGGIGNSCKCK